MNPARLYYRTGLLPNAIRGKLFLMQWHDFRAGQHAKMTFPGYYSLWNGASYVKNEASGMLLTTAWRDSGAQWRDLSTYGWLRWLGWLAGLAGLAKSTSGLYWYIWSPAKTF